MATNKNKVTLRKETIIKTYGKNNVTTEVRKEYTYNSEKSKLKHCQYMIEQGYDDSGLYKDNIGTLENPEYIWAGIYLKKETENT